MLKQFILLIITFLTSQLVNGQLKLIDSIAAALNCENIQCLQESLIDASFGSGKCDTTVEMTQDIYTCSYHAKINPALHSTASPDITVHFYADYELTLTTIYTNDTSFFTKMLAQFDNLKIEHYKQISSPDENKSTDIDFGFPGNNKLRVVPKTHQEYDKYCMIFV